MNILFNPKMKFQFYFQKNVNFLSILLQKLIILIVISLCFYFLFWTYSNGIKINHCEFYCKHKKGFYSYHFNIDVILTFLDLYQGNSMYQMDNPVVSIYLTSAPKIYNCGINEVCVISMSLFGSNPQYTIGAVENAKLVNAIFPGWTLRIYIPKDKEHLHQKLNVPSNIIKDLQRYDVDIHWVGNKTVMLNPRMWRFLVADDLSTDRFIIRDTDSRLFTRDAIEIEQWIHSGEIFHCLRDHPHHGNYPVLAGMWGAMTKRLKNKLKVNFSKLMAGYANSSKFSDQQFLKNEIWPEIQNFSYCSDSFFCKKYPHAHPFRTKRSKKMHFIGEIFDEKGQRIQHHINLLQHNPENPKCSPKI